RRPVVQAKRPVAKVNQPVKKGWFIEVWLSLQIGDNPVASNQHLARDFSIAAFIRLEEIERQTTIEKRGWHDQQDQEAPEPERLAGSGLAGEQNIGPKERKPQSQAARQLRQRAFADRKSFPTDGGHGTPPWVKRLHNKRIGWRGSMQVGIDRNDYFSAAA